MARATRSKAYTFEDFCILVHDEQKVTLLRLAANGKYREMRPRKGALHS
jgi:hypothetical protein